MYEDFANVAIDKLLFRPMVPDEERDMLVSGTWAVTNSGQEQGGPKGELRPEGSHLTCFVGGMFAMGARIFERKGDLDVAAKLTDGCIWAYNSTTTGIMPETFRLAPCESRKDCAWNETKWHDLLDPLAENRQAAYKLQLERMKEQAALAAAEATEPASASLGVEHVPARPTTVPPVEPTATAETRTKEVKKRQAGDLGNKILNKPLPVTGVDEDVVHVIGGASFVSPPMYRPSPPPTHEEFVKARIERDRIPPGFISINDKRYILR